MSSKVDELGKLCAGFAPVNLFETFSVWRQRAASRKLLGTLPDEMLKDIGLNRTEADGESRKPFWRT